MVHYIKVQEEWGFGAKNSRGLGLSALFAGARTNLKDSIDQAFLRRIPFVLNFPFPNKEARAEIWRRVFPSQTPTEQLNYERLGQLNIAGGNIRSIALNAAVLAADAEESVQMQHIFKATQSEYIKLGRVMVNTETQGWLK
nr:hypothetical protein [Spirulina major]